MTHGSKVFCLKGCIPLIIVAMVNAFHVNFTATYVIGQCSLQDMLDLNILNGTTLHSEEIMSDYKYYTPVALFEALLKYIPNKGIKTL